jgi:putative copper resistance protein D
LTLLANDCLHLVTAGAWVGGLLPLALFLAAASRHDDPNALPLAAKVTGRFSTVGIVLVATILTTGIVNTWHLVGSVEGLIVTAYGRLLITKIALFLSMAFFRRELVGAYLPTVNEKLPSVLCVSTDKACQCTW